VAGEGPYSPRDAALDLKQAYENQADTGRGKVALLAAKALSMLRSSFVSDFSAHSPFRGAAIAGVPARPRCI
jgi:hypothetical protein